MFLKSLQAEGPVDALYKEKDDGLPAHEPAHPVQQLAVHHVRLLPRVREHSLKQRVVLSFHIIYLHELDNVYFN